MSTESPAPVPAPWLENAKLVNERFPTTLCLIDFDYTSGNIVRAGKPLGRARAIVTDVWTDENGKTRARLDHPVQGDLVLTLTKPDQQPEAQTFNLLKSAVIHKIPTEETIRGIVIEVVNKSWNNVVDNSAQALAEVGAVRGDLAALQHRVGSLPGLDAHAALEAAIRKSEAQVGAMLERTGRMVELVQKQAEARIAAQDAEIKDLREESRVMRDRLRALDTLVAELLADDEMPRSPAFMEPSAEGEAEAPPAFERILGLNDAGCKVWAEIQGTHRLHLQKACAKHEIPYPEKANSEKHRRNQILKSIQAMHRFQE